MLYAQIPPHLIVKSKERSRNEPVERAEEPLPVDVVRHANKQIDALLELEEHCRRQTELNLEEHYRRQSALCINPRCRFISTNMHNGWGENITDVRLRWSNLA